MRAMGKPAEALSPAASASVPISELSSVPTSLFSPETPEKESVLLNLVNGLQAIGATARDVIAILQAIKAAGALEADLEVI